MRVHAARFIAVTLLALAGGTAGAVTLGQIDTFQGGTTAGWSSGAANPTPPVVQASGGPAGSGDAYLLFIASGIPGPGGKLVGFSGPQWAGDYGAAGITAIAMDLDNLGNTALSLRLWLDGPLGASAVSTHAVTVPAGSGWVHVQFSLLPGALSGQTAAALANLADFRLYHATTANFPGENIAAVLGVDNISAVPETGSAWALGAGLALLAGLRARRRRRRR